MAFSFSNGTNLRGATLNCGLGVNQLQQTGNLVYEYNPLKVLRINSDKTINSTSYPNGSLVDLDSELLDFDLNHPIDILTQQSYDGSVNLIINDGSTNPKLINTRFSTTGMNTYQIVDREGDNDTNIYDESTFTSDISLYKKTNTIPKLSFEGLETTGNLKVGNYVFYFKLADSDGNETDFIAESGIVSCYIGNINDPMSEEGGIRDENSHKSVVFLLQNVDSSYNNIVVYYTRSSSDIDGNYIPLAYKLVKQFSVYNRNARITITGYEETQEISINDINATYNVVDNAKCQTVNQNMLFLGNVANADIPYRELTDLSLRFLPELNFDNSVGKVDQNYSDASEGYEYYNASNIYYRLGYWNDIYRTGVVYILNDYTLSPVFNVRGIYNLSENSSFDYYPVYDASGNREYINIDKETFLLKNTNENCKGVFNINSSTNQLTESSTIPLGLNFKIQTDALTELKKYVKGFFFVRQKRKPTTLCQAVTIGLESTGCFPTLPTSSSTYLVERFLDNDRTLTHNFERRIESINDSYVLKGYAALCPEFEQKQAFYNQLFTGTKYIVKQTPSKFTVPYFTRSGNYLYNVSYTSNDNSAKIEACNIMGIADSTQALIGNKQKFIAKAGEAEEAYKISYYKYNTKTDTANNILRGSFGPYLGMEGMNTSNMELVDIKIPDYDNNELSNYFQIRYEDPSAFRAISDRISIDDVQVTSELAATGNPFFKVSNIFRGDCYICNYTHRMIRNFSDPTAPTNDDIISATTWKDNYSATDSTKNAKINRGDVNAVDIGHWVTVKVCSSINLSLRSLDLTYPSEKGLYGRCRGFYPLQAMSATGESKIPESFVSNAGISNTLSDKYEFETVDVPAIKNKFHTRIMYSDVNVNDAFKNGYRTFRNEKYQDYPTTYGAITKLISLSSYLICVFEHGVALIPVNERALLSGADGGNVFINTANVLPENPKMLSDVFGSQWSESVLKTTNFVYGVDTVAKKIWRTDGQTFEILSDFKVQKFLNDNISLSEKETTPVIGIRNVKTHYNAFKKDIMFTFYDDINVLEENVWNLCFNEILNCFVTFYSWVPSYSANIDNVFFTFDRDTSKSITKLSNSYPLFTLTGSNISGSGNVLLSSFNWTPDSNGYVTLGTVTLNMNLDNTTVKYYIADDKVRKIYKIDESTGVLSMLATEVGPWTVPIKVKLSVTNATDNETGTITELPTYEGNLFIAKDTYISELTTSFWKHGKAGLMYTNVDIAPCNWYGKQHPFEFEFVVTDNRSLQKMYNDLNIISNNTKPESLHFEISGESYNFTDEKKNAYFRQEATKHLYQYNGADVVYDKNYLKVVPEQTDFMFATSDYKRQTIMFPLTYSRVDTINDIYDHYQSMTSAGKDYQWLSGTELVHDTSMNEYRLVTHIKACPFSEVYAQEISQATYTQMSSLGYTNIKVGVDNFGNTKYYLFNTYGRLNGNMNYQEDKWDVQIPSIHFWQKNEKAWTTHPTGSTVSYPPLNLVNNPLPESMPILSLSSDTDIPIELRNLGYSIASGSFDTTKWYGISGEVSTAQQDSFETRIRDKYLKVKIRYSGDKLAVITSIGTIFTVSYA